MDQYPSPFREVPGRGLGIASLVLGIIAITVAFIPCLGLFSFFPAVGGLVLAIISLQQSSSVKAKNGIAVGGLVCSIIAILIAGAQIYFLKEMGTKVHESYEYYESTQTSDSLGSRMLSLEVTSDSLQKDEEK